MTLAEAAEAVSGRLVGADPQARITGAVEYDSRRVGAGDLFVAFPGETVDGHDYAAGAVAAGAVAVLGTRAVPDLPMIIVPDPPAGGPVATGPDAAPGYGTSGALAAIGALASAVLARLPDLTVIGLTGSSGKTTTKDLIGGLAAAAGPTIAPPGSLNNELGLPYTVLRCTPQTRALVLEMGSRGLGHLRYLCRIAPPRIGVVLNVGVAHIGEFGSVETIALAKGELVEALPADGVAVLNADDQRVRAMAARTRARVVLVGESADAPVRAEGVRLDERGCARYTLVTPEGAAPVALAVPGRHQVGNSLAAVAVARELGIPVDRIAHLLGGLRLTSTRRMDVFERPGGVTVIDDSYNANPSSMTAALHALHSMAGAGAAGARARRAVAVLGYMAELGEFETAGHQEVGRTAAGLGVDRIIVVDPTAAGIRDGAAAVAGWTGTVQVVADQKAAIDALRTELRPGDVILVKGSRYRTWDVADFLRDPPDGVGTAADSSTAGHVSIDHPPGSDPADPAAPSATEATA